MENNQVRFHTLNAALAAVGIENRLDSTLCNAYIQGTTTMTAEEVAKRMCEMRFLHEFTNYSNIRLALFNEMRSSGIRPGNDKLSKTARVRALQESPFPETWPWMVESWADKMETTTQST